MGQGKGSFFFELLIWSEGDTEARGKKRHSN